MVDLTRVARNHVAVWHAATRLQVQRLQESIDSPPWGYTDALLFVLALRDLLRAAEFARNRCPGVSGKPIEQFEAAIPRARDVRDVIEHFDKYAVGKGDLQPKEQTRRRPEQQRPSEEWLPVDLAEHGQWLTETTIALGSELTLNWREAARAADDLGRAMLKALR